MNNAIRPSEDEYIPLKKFAQLVNKRVESIYNARSRGEDMPPTYKFGKYVAMRKSEVDAWILKRRELTAEAQLTQPEPIPIPRNPAGTSACPRPWERTTNPA